MPYLFNNKFQMFFIYLFSFIPLFYIIGNAVLDIVIVICALYVLTIYDKKFLEIFPKISFYLIIYLLIISVGFFQIENLIEFIILFRYAFLFYFIYHLFDKLHSQLFFKISLISIIMVSAVNIFQYTYPDIISWSQVNTSFSGEVVRVGGLFRDELISGSYILFFFPFSLIALREIPKSNIFFEYCLIIICFLGLLFSGERSAMISFIFFLFIYLSKNLKTGVLYIFLFATLSSIVFFDNYYIFKRYTFDLIYSIFNLDRSNYIGLFISPFKILIFDFQRIIFGFGAESFYNVCQDFIQNNSNEIYKCNIHPHNFYIEILFSFGIIPFFLLLFYYFKFLINYIRKFKNLVFREFILGASIIVFFMPFKTSASIFSQRFGFIFFFYLMLFFILYKNKSKNY